jgi:hypothetical protein
LSWDFGLIFVNGLWAGMNDSVRLRKELLSLIKELGNPGVFGFYDF